MNYHLTPVVSCVTGNSSGYHSVVCMGYCNSRYSCSSRGNQTKCNMELIFMLLVIRHLAKGRIKEKGDNSVASLILWMRT